MRISDWSSDVCSSDLRIAIGEQRIAISRRIDCILSHIDQHLAAQSDLARHVDTRGGGLSGEAIGRRGEEGHGRPCFDRPKHFAAAIGRADRHRSETRSEEHTSELQSLMRSSYAVFCLKQKNKNNTP